MNTDKRLSRATLGGEGAEARPPADPRSLRPRLVHLGLGAFHRAHQAVYTETAEARHGGGWGIAGVSQRSRSVVDALGPQDGLYSLTLREPDGPRTRVVGSVTEVLHAAGDGPRLTGLIASPDVTVVTTTVTEKGYRRDPAGGGLDTADPAVRDDLAGAPVPATVVGQLAAGLRARRRTGAPLSVAPCDNMADNGRVLRRLVGDFVAAAGWSDGDALLEWIAASVAFPSTVVDRIVPAASEADRRAAEAALGLRDEGAVTGEPFTQWVLEDAFAAERPRWESGGALLVPDVAPYQLMKLRLLNGSHSLLAYLGLAAGCETVADTMETPWGEPVVRAYTSEVARTLDPAAGLDTSAYVDSLLSRFANRAMGHRLEQIAMDGSLKIPERWLAPLRDLRAGGRDAPVLAAALAAWARHTRDGGRLDDPAADRLRAAWTHPGHRALRELLHTAGAPELAGDSVLVAEIGDRLAALDRDPGGAQGGLRRRLGA
ncbi:mannitol dehydrogenase family protein [Streptomyces sp. Ru87]|uniref:mannitol dehydrogenase family protein n=1 Tax=Streptomyces sp. Ru87 TaxID=2044307 RepID=UPI000BF4A1E6|nr:mannitol dehydrogenase family protein [Streptomyces sp. Ru87]PGH47332.1 mannitol dehydrogenase [Streptomyces sp. Ru87]